jgi:hypothetical protein
MDINLQKNFIYNNITNYYDNPVFIKVNDTPVNKFNVSFSVYYCKVGCMLCVDDRYLIAMVYNDGMPVGNNERLSNLKWISFQTRTLESTVKMNSIDIKPKSNTFVNTYVELSEVINNENLNKYIYYYNSLKIELLSNDVDIVYSNKGTIKSCLESYNCVLSFIL